MVDLLKKCSIFKQLRPQELEEIAKISQLVGFREGDKIFEKGEDAVSLYIVNVGEVKLKFSVYHLNAPIVLTLDTIKIGKPFGWSAFAEPYKYTLSAHAARDTKLFQIRADEIRKLCEKNQHLGYVLMNNIATIISARFTRLQGLLQHVIQGYLE